MIPVATSGGHTDIMLDMITVAEMNISMTIAMEDANISVIDMTAAEDTVDVVVQPQGKKIVTRSKVRASGEEADVVDLAVVAII